MNCLSGNENTPTENKTHYYHASEVDQGDQFTFTDGGYYEKIDGKTPLQSRIGGEFIGWQTSDTEEFCASETPQAAALAKLQHITQHSQVETNDESKETIDIHIYEITEYPDTDLTNTIAGDFKLLEEVRFNMDSKDEIPGTKTYTINFPKRVLEDISLIYLPNGPYIITEWGKAVKKAIAQKIRTGIYPSNIEDIADTTRPDQEKYTTVQRHHA